MDLWCMNLKNATLLPSSAYEKPICSNVESKAKLLLLRYNVKSLMPSGFRRSSLVVKAMGKNNPENINNNDNSSSGSDDQSIPGGDGLKRNNTNDGRSHNSPPQKSHNMSLDWREFRANLFAQELAENEKPDADDENAKPHENKSFSSRWAHPISVPETGCVLVATEKLDGVRTFERTVILLLRSGTRHPQEGPFGVVINRPLNKRIRQMKPNNIDLATTFSDCSVLFGGPLEASIFLLKTAGKKKLSGFEEVIPGLSFGARNSLDEAANLVKKGVLKPQDVKFFVGYAGWQLDQLQEEIESDFWYVAACSSDLIFRSALAPSEGLWEEILQLMGGHYSDLSRKPKQDM